MLDNVFVSDRFETWRTCHYKYYLKYIKQLRLPEPKANYELGKTIHALVCYYLRGFEITPLEESLDVEKLNHWNSLKNHPIITNKLIATEWRFEARVNGTDSWLNGRIDAVFYDTEADKYIIADWKTGQNLPKEPEDSFQTRIYLYSFFKAQKDLKLDFPHEKLVFQYIKTAAEAEAAEPIYYSHEKEIEYENQFRTLIEEIHCSENFPPREDAGSKSCKYCPYQKFCF